ncbi:hypothetical protein [Nitrospira sp. Ecomares 2.1]
METSYTDCKIIVRQRERLTLLNGTLQTSAMALWLITPARSFLYVRATG